MIVTHTGTVNVHPVERAIELLRDRYVFPERGEAAATTLRQRLTAGGYDGLDESTLAKRLTEDLLDVCPDAHLWVRVRDERRAPAKASIRRVEILDGNIGYLDVRRISGSTDGGRAIVGSMELVSRTDALILDLRGNEGGSPDGVALWSSYFLPAEPTHLNSIYDRVTGQTRQFWSLTWLPGERYLDRPLYVLTSDRTFSGAEELCLNLKVRGRARLVGETTRGGANLATIFALTPTMEIAVPHAYSINPITGGNWEGTGIEPDLAVPAAAAFDVAYAELLERAPGSRSDAGTE
ncbi:S41 family peptidase [Micromonospora sp. NPDC092111]|uniref:S41 family peptidase n=1 Tax=Micromonospora sp. NPDC092111 TaxID=3364289 RepID=UPI0038179852